MIRLYCLPWAGGTAAEYHPWRGALGDRVEICPVELPGRGGRSHQRPADRIGPLLDAILPAMDTGTPYALFGHSLGALIAFEAARELRRRGAGEPLLLAVSAAPAPSLPRTRPPLHDAGEADVIARLLGLGGLPDELRAEPGLLRYALPAVRADFAVFETYTYAAEPPLSCPVTAFSGRDDSEVPPARMAAWRAETTGAFAHHTLPGGHFFLRTGPAALLTRLRDALDAETARSTR